MTNKPKVAIFMPSYNHEKYVAEAIDSILAQTYENWELFIVDDASTDNTASIVAGYKDDRIHFYPFYENTAQAGALLFLNNIIRNIDCEYISGLASDDLYKPDKLKRQVDFLEEHPEYKICFAWDTVIMEEGAWEQYNSGMCHSYNQSRYDWIRTFFRIGNHINANTMMMRKETFFEWGGMNGKYLQLADYRLWFKCAIKYPFYMLEEELIYYRRHSTNLSNPSLEQMMRGMQENLSIYADIMDNIDKETFYRAFYQDVPYKTAESDYDLLADKFILLLNSGESMKEQVALDLFYKFADDKGLSEALKERYSLKEIDFKKLYGNVGMGFLCNELSGQQIMPQKKPTDYLPMCILLNSIDAGKLTVQTISDFTYSALRGIYLAVASLDNQDMFVKIKEYLSEIRRNRIAGMEHKSCIIIAASVSKRQITDILSYINGEYEHIYFYIMGPREENLLKGSPKPMEDMPDGVEYIDLYDMTNTGLRFADEIIKDLSDVYYVDFVGEEYEYAEMTAGYSLGVSQNLIIYSQMMGMLSQKEKEALHIMDKVIQT